MKFRKAAAALAFASLSVSVAAIGQVRSSSRSTQTDEAVVEAAYDRKDATSLAAMAQAGNASAQFRLGVMYNNGEGVTQDYREAVRLYSLSAAQGHAKAQINLGVIYATGSGVPTDFAQAYHWFSLSAAGASDPDIRTIAAKNRDLALSKMQKNFAPAAAPPTTKWLEGSWVPISGSCESGEPYRFGPNARWATEGAEGVWELNGNLINITQEIEYDGEESVPVEDGLITITITTFDENKFSTNGTDVSLNKWKRCTFANGSLAPEEDPPAATSAEIDKAEVAVAETSADRKDVGALTALAEAGNADAQNRLGNMYDEGLGVVKNQAAALRWYRASAEQGYVKAQYNLGRAFALGSGVAQSDVAAFDWFRKAAQQGYADAQSILGDMYAQGAGVAQDDYTAVSWYRKAAEQGYADAQNGLGLMYDNGRGVGEDTAIAVSWFRKAAEQGFADAQYNLGLMYDYGRGVGEDAATAVSWFRKAAEQGYADAQDSLGTTYYNGRGVAQNYTTALVWYRKAAEQGNTEAQLNLGVMYAEGAGVAQDFAQAYHWFSLSAAGTTDPELKANAEKYRDIVSSEMQKNSAPAATPMAPPKANPTQIASKNVPAAPAKNANPGKPIFCEFRQGEDEGWAKFVIYIGSIKSYGGGNAWEAPISFGEGDPFTIQFEFPKKAKLNYGAGMYTISSPTSKSSFSFDRDEKNWAYIDDENYVNCDFDK